MSLSGLIVRNWRLKIAALALAVLLWVTMRLTDGSVGRLTIPDVEVRVEQVHRDWFLKEAPFPSTVQMSVSGPQGELVRVAMSRPAMVIRVDSVLSEDSVVTLIPDWVSNVDRSSVTIENFAPSSVRLLFERNKEEEIPVSVRLSGSLPDSLAMVSEPRANLLFTRVRGAASLVNELETVFLEPFDLSRIAGSGRFDVALDTAGLGGLAVNPVSATVSVEVAPKQSRVVPLQVSVPGGVGELVVDPATVPVTLYGAGEVLERMDSSALRLRVVTAVDELRRVLEEVEDVRAPLALSGLPRWVEGVVGSDSVSVRREEEP